MADPATLGKMAAMSAVSTAVESIQTQAQARAQARAQHAATQRRVQQERIAQEQREKNLREQSKREQARARAGFGARGVSSAGGSAHALLDGIASDTEDRIADDRRMTDFGIEFLRANQQDQQRVNLLKTRNRIFNTILDEGSDFGESYLESTKVE